MEVELVMVIDAGWLVCPTVTRAGNWGLIESPTLTAWAEAGASGPASTRIAAQSTAMTARRRLAMCRRSYRPAGAGVTRLAGRGVAASH